MENSNNNEKKPETRLVKTENKSPERKDPSYRDLVKRIGGREGLREMVALSNNPKAKALLEVIDDPAFKTYGVKKLASQVGLTRYEIYELSRNKHFQEALLTAFEEIPEIVKSAAKYAKEQQELCAVCDRGIVQPKKEGDLPKVCKKCRGTGIIFLKPDKDARDFIGKATKFIETNPMLQVNNTQVNNSNSISTGSFEDIIKKAETISVRRVIEPENIEDAEIIDEST